MWFQNTVSGAELLCNNFTDILLLIPRNSGNGCACVCNLYQAQKYEGPGFEAMPTHTRKNQYVSFAKNQVILKETVTCDEFAKVKGQSSKPHGRKKTMGAFKVTISAENESDSEDEGGLVVQHALSVDIHAHDQWILDSGACATLKPCSVKFKPCQSL